MTMAAVHSGIGFYRDPLSLCETDGSRQRRRPRKSGRKDIAGELFASPGRRDGEVGRMARHGPAMLVLCDVRPCRLQDTR